MPAGIGLPWVSTYHLIIPISKPVLQVGMNKLNSSYRLGVKGLKGAPSIHFKGYSKDVKAPITGFEITSKGEINAHVIDCKVYTFPQNCF